MTAVKVQIGPRRNVEQDKISQEQLQDWDSYQHQFLVALHWLC